MSDGPKTQQDAPQGQPACYSSEYLAALNRLTEAQLGGNNTDPSTIPATQADRRGVLRHASSQRGAHNAELTDASYTQSVNAVLLSPVNGL